MKERPIPFSDAMVRAVQAGTKRQTRRPVKLNAAGRAQLGGRNWHLEDPNVIKACPYGQPGDRLWVREAWRIGCWDQETGRVAVDYRADGSARREWLQVPDNDVFLRLWQQSCDDAYAAGIHPFDGFFKWEPGQSPCRWRPPMFMFRWASRITLEITGVRVERLQDISNADIRAEGACTWASVTHRLDFQGLWESINGAESWDANPWVWVVEFRRLP